MPKETRTVDKPSSTATPPGRSGEFACIAAAWRDHEPELRGFLRHRVSDEQAAADVLQDVFVKAMRQGQGFCTLDNPRAWLFQVARNTLVDRARTAHPTEPLADDADACATPAPEPVAPVDALADCLARTLAELPAGDADIVRACDLEGRTLRAYAETQGLSLPAAKSRLLRARERLRQRMTTACRVDFEPDGRVAGHVPRPPLV
jgi:RNA polymerase sigma-70 factor (ECF subfamily)